MIGENNQHFALTALLSDQREDVYEDAIILALGLLRNQGKFHFLVELDWSNIFRQKYPQQNTVSA